MKTCTEGRNSAHLSPPQDTDIFSSLSPIIIRSEPILTAYIAENMPFVATSQNWSGLLLKKRFVSLPAASVLPKAVNDIQCV